MPNGFVFVAARSWNRGASRFFVDIYPPAYEVPSDVLFVSEELQDVWDWLNANQNGGTIAEEEAAKHYCGRRHSCP